MNNVHGATLQSKISGICSGHALKQKICGLEHKKWILDKLERNILLNPLIMLLHIHHYENRDFVYHSVIDLIFCIVKYCIYANRDQPHATPFEVVERQVRLCERLERTNALSNKTEAKHNQRWSQLSTLDVAV